MSTRAGSRCSPRRRVAFEAGADLGVEGAQNASDDRLLLCEAAARTIGDGCQSLPDSEQFLWRAAALCCTLQQASDLQPVLLARRALTARLDGEESSSARGEADRSGLLGDHHESCRSEAAARGGHRFVAQCRVELRRRQHCARHADHDRA
jgi:hypothetical protein